MKNRVRFATGIAGFLLFVAFGVTLALYQNFSSGLPGFNVWDSRPNTDFVLDSSSVPFSFQYGSALFNANTWTTVSSTPTKRVYRDPSGVLEATFTIQKYPAFGAVKWVLQLKNVSSSATSAVLSDVNAGHIQLIGDKGTSQPFVINYMTGCLESAQQKASPNVADFTPVRNAPPRNTGLALHSTNGRASSGTMPYFNIEAPGGGAGVVVAVGWSGQWKTNFSVDGSGTNLQIRAGQENFSAQLRPGESIRTPSMLLMPYTGSDLFAGQNKFRKLMLTSFSPRNAANELPAPIAAASSGALPIAWENVHASDLITMSDSVAAMNLPVNTFWHDAGWYKVVTQQQDASLYNAIKDSLWISGVGDWVPDPARFPQGYGPVSDSAHSHGWKSLLWFEPERMAFPASNYTTWGQQGKLLQSHFTDPNSQKLFGSVNFSDVTNVNDMLAIIDSKINAGHIDIFRQDMNGDGPLPDWLLNDQNQSKGMGNIARTGMTEAGYIAGLYYFWDQLRARHPGLIIDNCAGGGRRLDFEALSRTVPLWRSDRVWDAREQQDQMLGLAWWAPLQGRGSDVDTSTSAPGLGGVEGVKYKVRSGSGWMGSFAFPWNGMDPAITDYLRSDLGTFFGKSSPLGPQLPLSQIFMGDFYPMPYSQAGGAGSEWPGSIPSYTSNLNVWAGWEFFRPDMKAGVVQAFRRSTSAPESFTFVMRGLTAKSVYNVVDLDQPSKGVFRTGSQLMTTGLQINCQGVACSRVFTVQDTRSSGWVSRILPILNDYIAE